MHSSEIHPYRVEVPQIHIDDLRTRLRATRWPEGWPDPTWDYGVDTEFLRDLCTYWSDHYDWRLHEERLNSFPQYVTTIDTTNLHFIHVRSPEPSAVPLLMTHGWPGSIVEFLDVIGPLTDPAAYGGSSGDAFHVVCPSIPGFGFSGPTHEPGWSNRRVAEVFAQLMDVLGYETFGAQGGDWGASISTWLGVLYPRRVFGVHLNTVALQPDSVSLFSDTTRQEAQAFDRLNRYLTEGAGYVAIQSTRPNTVGAGLDDSPAGLCAWIVDKFWDWADHSGDLYEAFTRDQLLTNISVYWFTRTASSAARLYRESARAGTGAYALPRLELPTGVSIFPAEISTPSRRHAETRYNVVYYRHHQRGGHFAAFEVPDLLVADIREYFRIVRSPARQRLESTFRSERS